MTVDMLAATFFWPEGALLGSRHPHPDEEADHAIEETEASDRPEVDDGFWSSVVRHLWRPSARTVDAP